MNVSRSPLCCCLMFPINQMRSITKLRFPVFAVSPDACAFSIQTTVGTIVDNHIGQTFNNRSCFQIATIWILQKIIFWLQIFDNVKACLNKFVCCFEIPWSLSSGSSYWVLCAVWGSPDHLKVSRFKRSFVVPSCDVCLNLCVEAAIPSRRLLRPIHFPEGYSNRPCARTEKQCFGHF